MDEIHVGPHRLAKRGKELIELHFGQTPEEWEMKELMARLVEARQGQRTAMLIDFREVETLKPEVRRVVGEGSRSLDVASIAMYGASFHLRVVAKLVNSAIALFKKDAVPQEFFADRESAVAWLAQRGHEEEA